MPGCGKRPLKQAITNDGWEWMKADFFIHANRQNRCPSAFKRMMDGWLSGYTVTIIVGTIKRHRFQFQSMADAFNAFRFFPQFLQFASQCFNVVLPHLNASYNECIKARVMWVVHVFIVIFGAKAEARNALIQRGTHIMLDGYTDGSRNIAQLHPEASVNVFAVH